MPNVKKFYQKIWDNIQNSDKTFFIDSFKVQKSYKQLSNDIKKISKIFFSETSQLTVILANKNYEHYCCVISTVLSGNTWIPLSIENPFQRNLQIIKSLKPNFFITDQEINEETKIQLNKLGIKTYYIEDCFNKLNGNNDFVFNFNYSKSSLSMIYFTSGSTGIPKGVEISQEGFSTAVQKIVPLLKISDEIWGDYHDLSFVISINILFKCIYSKGTLYCASNKLEQFMPLQSLLKNKISCLVTVPSTLARISKDKNFKQLFTSLKTIVSCGEPLPIDIMSLYLQDKTTKLFNFYGSTELTTWIFYHRCKKIDVSRYSDYGYAPIGKIIQGNQIATTNENLLLVKSPQVTPGYFGKDKTSHLYRHMEEDWFSTGDVVEKVNDVLICKGRLDNQIKLNGYRIHLMDIETQIKKIKKIEDCMCVVEEINEQKLITAILITEKNFTIIELRDLLKDKLSNYMFPKKVLCIKEKPINKNGKLDRTKLKELIFQKV